MYINDFDNLFSFDEDMNNTSTIVISKKYNLTITVCKTNHIIGNEYFKIHNNSNYRYADKTARISIRNPKYIIKEKENWVLSNIEKQQLIIILNQKSDILILNNEFKTNWQYILWEYCYDNELIIENDYGQLSDNSYFKLDMPIPNYMLLD